MQPTQGLAEFARMVPTVMDTDHQQPYTLIVRLWREQLETTSWVWTGTLECLQTREKTSFQTISHLSTQIANMFDANQAIDDEIENDHSNIIQGD